MDLQKVSERKLEKSRVENDKSLGIAYIHIEEILMETKGYRERIIDAKLQLYLKSFGAVSKSN